LDNDVEPIALDILVGVDDGPSISSLTSFTSISISCLVNPSLYERWGPGNSFSLTSGMFAQLSLDININPNFCLIGTTFPGWFCSSGTKTMITVLNLRGTLSSEI